MQQKNKQDKGIKWVGSTREDLLNFPTEARKEVGFQLGKVEAGLDPSDWKPFDEVGKGVKEIRVRDVTGIYRVMYVAKFEESIYILHCFQKKTETTTKNDIKIAKVRYDDIIEKRKAKK